MQIVLDLRVVHNDGMVNAATFQKDVQATLKVVEVPPQLRRLEFARTSPSGKFPHFFSSKSSSSHQQFPF